MACYGEYKHKKVISNQSSKAVKKGCEKRCEIQGGGQEMAVMVGKWQKI